MNLVAWAALLLFQSAANTFISRARNSGSYAMHSVASLLSNGIWFINQIVSLDLLLPVLHERNFPAAIPLGIVYVGASIVGSVGMHYISKTYIETRSNRKVGG